MDFLTFDAQGVYKGYGSAPDYLFSLLPANGDIRIEGAPPTGRVALVDGQIVDLPPLEPEPISYYALRALAYPDRRDYFDAQVKKNSADAALQEEGAAQEQAYFAACEAVKALYPKP